MDYFIMYPWRDDVLDTPILRASSDALSGAEVQGGTTAKRLKSLGEKMGYPETVTWYWLRRLVLNAVDGSYSPTVQASSISLTPIAAAGSEEVRNQVAGHLNSRTYRNNYQDQRITLDVGSLVRGQATEDTLIRKLNDMGTNADPGANVVLPREALQHIGSLPDVASLQSEHRRLAKALQDKYISITRAAASETLVDDYRQAKTAHRTGKEFYKARVRSQLRKDFFVQKNAAIIEAQLSGGDALPTAQAERKAPTLCIEERITLVNLASSGDARDPSMYAHRAAAVQAMADPCSRKELRRKSLRSNVRLRQESSPENIVPKTEERFPMHCHRLQCLFCIGDERLHLKERLRVFSQQYTLGRHFDNHIKALGVTSGILCPHPKCKDAGTTLDGVQHLKTHAQKEHGIRLQCQ